MKPDRVVAALLDEGFSGKVKCRQGWIYYKPMAGGRYYVTATGHRAMTISEVELRSVLGELARELGGQIR